MRGLLPRHVWYRAMALSAWSAGMGILGYHAIWVRAPWPEKAVMFGICLSMIGWAVMGPRNGQDALSKKEEPQ
jgi:hypothetical protein